MAQQEHSGSSTRNSEMSGDSDQNSDIKMQKQQDREMIFLTTQQLINWQ